MERRKEEGEGGRQTEEVISSVQIEGSDNMTTSSGHTMQLPIVWG